MLSVLERATIENLGCHNIAGISLTIMDLDGNSYLGSHINLPECPNLIGFQFVSFAIYDHRGCGSRII